tara:strand:+ start:5736 stop:6413 length:678 start_codon:yes stop_codon:yes gene_type:complete
MFKKKCPKCNTKVNKNYEFCPFCGKDLKSRYDNEDFGFLGKNDSVNNDNQEMFGGSIIDKMMNSAMKMIEKQMRNLPNELANQNNQNNPNANPQTNPFQNFSKPGMKIKFMVNGKEIPIKNLSETSQKPQKMQAQISEEKAKKLAKLPRKEPKTVMKRLSGKLIYELSIPGVKDVEDVLINQLESSIEIKAIAKDKVYSKTISITLPIKRYTLIKGNLILEFQAK